MAAVAGRTARKTGPKLETYSVEMNAQGGVK